jgi:MoxR-like ATPase
LIEGARALAFLRGRSYVLPQDIQDLVLDVLRHRVVLSYEAIALGKTADDLLRQILKAIPVPTQALPIDA